MTGESSELSIGALAARTGVPVKTIRFYSDQGLLPPRRRTRARYRRYDAADQVRLEQIRTLRELGFGLDAIRALLGAGHDPRAVLGAQVGALDRELAHLTRARAVLARALDGDADPVATTLRVGAIMRLAAWEREAALRAHLETPLRATAVDRRWLDGLLTAAFAGLPEQLDDDQWAAYVELVALVTDPSFGEALARQARGAWTGRRFDATRFHAEAAAIIARGAALLAADPALAPAAPAAQALADDYLAATARALGRRTTRGLAAHVTRGAALHDPRSERFWDLVAIVRRQPPPPHGKVMRLIFAALAGRA